MSEYLEEQADELEVLASIYPDELGCLAHSEQIEGITHFIHVLPDQSGGDNFGDIFIFHMHPFFHHCFTSICMGSWC